MARRFFVAISKVLFGPFFRLGIFGFRKAAVMSFRGVYAVKRHGGSIGGGRKRNILFAFSNRWVVHISIIIIATLAGVVNLRGGDVRAEGFGEQSLLFSLVSDQLALVVEEVVAEPVHEVQLENYFGAGLVGINEGVDSHSADDNYVTTTVGGAVVAPVIVESKPSIAPRTSVLQHVIASGDTLGGIAETYNLSLNTLLWANSLSFRSTLKIGNVLSIPPVDGVLHTVKSGENLSYIAKKYSADVDNIITFNKLASADDLSVGEDLIIPGGEVQASAPSRSIAPVKSLFSGTPTKAPARSALPAGSGSWVWPTDLRYITQYYGWRHTGVDIDCNGHNSSTNSNYAAADGVVVYAGWRNGYGSTVEIDHGNGIKTRYGHNAQIYVNNGQVVTAGTPISLCGNTGRSTGTHLHFEVIVSGRFKNPLEYIR